MTMTEDTRLNEHDSALVAEARHYRNLEIAQHLCVITVLGVGAVVAEPATIAAAGRFRAGGRSRAGSQPAEPSRYLGRLTLALASFLLLPLATAQATHTSYGTVERGTVLILAFLLVPVVARGLAVRRALSAHTACATRLTTAEQALRRLPLEVLSVVRLP